MDNMHPSPRAILSTVRTLVVKLGTQLLTNSAGQLDAAFIELIAGQVASLRQREMRVTIVSSGAIGAGLRELKLPARPTDLGKLQGSCSRRTTSPDGRLGGGVCQIVSSGRPGVADA